MATEMLSAAESSDRPADRRGDPQRGLDLLWRGLEPAQRGPRARLSLAELTAAGIALADREGLEALSIRRVATALGVGPMTIYTYVPSKVELVELMIDEVFGELAPPPADLDWRGRIEVLAEERWRMYARHPWVLQSNLSRIPLGPHVLDSIEQLYAAFAPLPLAAEQVVALVGVLDAYLQGASRTEAIEAQEVARTGVSYDEYWEARASFWERYFDPERYPEHVRIWNSGGFETVPSGFEAGLRCLLDGIEVMVGRR